MTEKRADLQPDQRSCERCHGPYTPNKPWQKYCSPACRRGSHQTIHLSGLPVTIGRLSTRKSGCLSLSVLIASADGERAIKMFGTQGTLARLATIPEKEIGLYLDEAVD